MYAWIDGYRKEISSTTFYLTSTNTELLYTNFPSDEVPAHGLCVVVGADGVWNLDDCQTLLTAVICERPSGAVFTNAESVSELIVNAAFQMLCRFDWLHRFH